MSQICAWIQRFRLLTELTLHIYFEGEADDEVTEATGVHHGCTACVDGRWAMSDERWAMGDGRWAMGDGRWAMGDGR
jgi:hypothetical protein